MIESVREHRLGWAHAWSPTSSMLRLPLRGTCVPSSRGGNARSSCILIIRELERWHSLELDNKQCSTQHRLGACRFRYGGHLRASANAQ